MRTFTGLAVVGLLASWAQGVQITCSTTGATEIVTMSGGLDATVSLDPSGPTVIDLEPGVEEEVLLNTGQVDWWLLTMQGGSGSISVDLTISADGVGPVTQSTDQVVAVIETVDIGGVVGSAQIFGSVALFYDLGTLGELMVLPVGGSVISSGSPASISNGAIFLLTVPEPGVMGLGLLPMAMLWRRRVQDAGGRHGRRMGGD